MEFDHEKIYSLAKQYDLINDFDFDIPFYLNYAKNGKKNVLELACGTARVSIALAKENINVVGIDVSDEMLNEATFKAKKEKVNIVLKKQNIIDFDLNKKFDLILCVHNSFSHINGLDNLRSFFNSVKRHLSREGIFILQVFNPDFYFFTRDPSEKFPLKKYKDPNTNEMVELSENNFYDDESQINYIKWYFKIGNKETVVNWNQRVYFPQELDYLVQLFDFEIIDKFGDFDNVLFEENPETQILILKSKKVNEI